MAIYMKFEGIDGEVVEKTHEKWVEVHSVQNGAHKGGSGQTGSQRVAGVTIFEDIVITKNTDKTTPKLLKAMAVGTSFDKVEIHSTVTTDSGPQVYLSYELKNVYITNYNISASGEGRAMESAALNYEEIKIEYFPVDAKGKKGGG
ncbi:MAG: type VI secretion system tube protein Hcp, partial [Pirellulaceae bacterium]|nr:type VI secretion system tube protein Hcp [Pirellulaceae bacterium]